MLYSGFEIDVVGTNTGGQRELEFLSLWQTAQRSGRPAKTVER
jgi:hypothetical protein